MEDVIEVARTVQSAVSNGGGIKKPKKRKGTKAKRPTRVVRLAVIGEFVPVPNWRDPDAKGRESDRDDEERGCSD